MAFTNMFVGDIELMERFGAAPARRNGVLWPGRPSTIEALHHRRNAGASRPLEHAIEQRYGIDTRMGHARKNPTYPRFAQQPPAVQDLLRELCQHDMMIYEAFAEEVAFPGSRQISRVPAWRLPATIGVESG